MPGRERLKQIVNDAVRIANAETGHITHAAHHPGEVSERYVADAAATAHEEIDKAAEAATILVREGG